MSRIELVGLEGGRVDDPLAVPPADLPEEQRDFWHRYAPLAIAAHTLTPQMVAAFRLLCELEAEKRGVKATIDKDGRTYLKVFVDSSGQEHEELKAHPLTSAYRNLAQRVEALLARFSLAPFGKPTEITRRQPTVNPWAQVAGKRA